MIIDLGRFLAAERPHWIELERMLNRLETDPACILSLEETRQFHYLYERTSADLGRIMTFSSEPELRRYLEQLIGRAYGEIHETREKRHRLSVWRWFFITLPQTFRRHLRAFWVSLVATVAGCLLGALALAFDPGAKEVIMPFDHLLGSPGDRVAKEETRRFDPLQGQQSQFSTTLMTHNTRVAMTTLALGMTWGIGTLIVLFYNGVILGAVGLDYVVAGQARFLLAWLMPHGVIEIPAILIAGQAGLVLANALIGWGSRIPLGRRLREVSPDLMTFIFGVAILLIWAGLIEAFLSQYHEPTLPYSVKITFGSIELFLLVLFLSRAGRDSTETDAIPALNRS